MKKKFSGNFLRKLAPETCPGDLPRDLPRKLPPGFAPEINLQLAKKNNPNFLGLII